MVVAFIENERALDQGSPTRFLFMPTAGRRLRDCKRHILKFREKGLLLPMTVEEQKCHTEAKEHATHETKNSAPVQ